MVQKHISKKLAILTSMLFILSSASFLFPFTGAETRQNEMFLMVHVFDEETNLPIEEAVVELFLTEDNGNIVQQGRGLTDVNGSIRFEITPGTLVLAISKEGYEAKRLTVDATGGDPAYRAGAGLLPVQEQIEEITVSIWPVSVNGEHIGNAVAVMWSVDTDEVYRAASSDNGGIEIVVPQGRYDIEVNSEGYEPSFMTVEIFDPERFDITIEMIPLEPEVEWVEVHVCLLSPRSNERVMHGKVEMMNLETGEVFMEETGDDNLAVLKVTQGKYVVTAHVPDFGKAQGEFAIFDCREFKIEMVLEGEPEIRFGRIEGKVIDGRENMPLQKTRVLLTTEHPPGNDPNCDNSGPGLSMETWTDEKGHFWFEEVPCGIAAVSVFREGYHEDHQKVEVVPGDAAFLEFVLKPFEHEHEPEMVLVTGNVIQADNGEPVPEVEVRFYHENRVEEPRPEFECRPVIIFEYTDKNSDGHPEIMLLKADFDGDGRIDLHYVYLDENSDENPESINIKASFIPWGFEMPLPGLEEFMDMTGWDNRGEEDEWDDEWDDDWDECDGRDEGCDRAECGECQNGECRDEDTRGEGDNSDDDEREKEEQREREEQEKEERRENEEREKEEQREREEREKDEQRENEEREKEERRENKERQKEVIHHDDGFVAKTDDGGNFELKMPMGEYTVLVKARGYMPYKERVKIFPEMQFKEGEENLRPNVHIEITLIPENIDPQFVELPSLAGEDADGVGKAAMDLEIEEFMNDDTYELNIQPFQELVSGEQEVEGTDGTQAGNKGGETAGTGANAAESYVSAGVAAFIIMLLFVFIVVAKKRSRGTKQDDLEEVPDEMEEETPVEERIPRVRALRLKRRKRVVREG